MDTTERGVRGWKEAQRQGEFTDFSNGIPPGVNAGGALHYTKLIFVHNLCANESWRALLV
jgi:hypothetical protein